jgi:hypothetical protein
MPGGGDGQPLNLIEVCAELVKHHKLLPEQIERLDRWWIAHIYFHPRDKYGDLKISAKPKPPGITSDRKAAYRASCLAVGWPEWLIDHEWQKATKAVQEAKKRQAEPKRTKAKQPTSSTVKERRDGRQKGRG